MTLLCPSCGYTVVPKMPTNARLTRTQNQMVAFVRGIELQTGQGPTVPEINKAMGFGSINGAYRILKPLRERGLLLLTKRRVTVKPQGKQ